MPPTDAVRMPGRRQALSSRCMAQRWHGAASCSYMQHSALRKLRYKRVSLQVELPFGWAMCCLSWDSLWLVQSLFWVTIRQRLACCRSDFTRKYRSIWNPSRVGCDGGFHRIDCASCMCPQRKIGRIASKRHCHGQHL